MQLTMNDIMNFDLLDSARVLSGEKYLKERYVEWVSITENPVENFVRKNELVLTTGIGCEQNIDAFGQYVQDVVDSEASALAVATGRYIYDIPTEVIQLAEQAQFPIIDIPWEIRFADITHEVMKELNRRQQQELKESEKVQQQLINILLNGGNLDKVAQYVGKHIQAPVLITDKDGQVKGSARQTKEIRSMWGKLRADNKVPHHTFITDDTTHHPLHQKIHKLDHPPWKIVQLPIIQDVHRVLGFLFIILHSTHPLKEHLSHFSINLLEHASTASALWFLRENAVLETEFKLRDDFVCSIAKGDLTSWERISERARLLGYDVSVPYVCIVGYPENLRAMYEKSDQIKHTSYEKWLHSMVYYIEEEVVFASQSLEKQLLMTYQLDEIIIFLEATVVSRKDSVHYFLDLLERRLGNLLPGVVMSWGIGRVYDEELKFTKSYRDAQQSLEIGRRQKGPGQRMYYDDSKVERILLSLSENEEVQHLSESVITPLINYDQVRQMELVRTFIIFTQHHYNVSKTARSLSLHRQSLLYRLRKIEKLTKLSLVNPDDLFLLNLSIRIWLATSAPEDARNYIHSQKPLIE
ncbi:PucR family transcriptional regulator [Alkalihalobacterium chitinilyticum]|uniref:PucR family transcriptional regulator ligand-binding domain-containing protein n=1 Tax=Alkalihalobacterium chitinilyticum TaxID=2980103 RepID=A0ABT5VE77_9BACI|nr:PucR family transcriptional regulator [Alkalihalobacterium chitinilyticum]MDE5413764.1 PucR family transcriptional regulator ligand-binding domain-containing protein [Alkalihalobacterium chitinilyticum]